MRRRDYRAGGRNTEPGTRHVYAADASRDETAGPAQHSAGSGAPERPGSLGRRVPVGQDRTPGDIGARAVSPGERLCRPVARPGASRRPPRGRRGPQPAGAPSPDGENRRLSRLSSLSQSEGGPLSKGASAAESQRGREHVPPRPLSPLAGLDRPVEVKSIELQDERRTVASRPTGTPHSPAAPDIQLGEPTNALYRA